MPLESPIPSSYHVGMFVLCKRSVEAGHLSVSYTLIIILIKTFRFNYLGNYIYFSTFYGVFLLFIVFGFFLER